MEGDRPLIEQCTAEPIYLSCPADQLLMKYCKGCDKQLNDEEVMSIVKYLQTLAWEIRDAVLQKFFGLTLKDPRIVSKMKGLGEAYVCRKCIDSVAPSVQLQ